MSLSKRKQNYSELDAKIAETWRHIQTERKILEATQLLRQATSNQDVLRRNEAKIRETERSLAYFEVTLRDLQELKKQQQQQQRDGPPRFGTPGVPEVGFTSFCKSFLLIHR